MWVLNVLEEFNREALAIEIDTSLAGGRLIRVFQQLAMTLGLPDILRTDNGPEFLGCRYIDWCGAHGLYIESTSSRASLCGL